MALLALGEDVTVSNPALWIGFGFVLVMLLASTGFLSLRGFSRGRLAAGLERRGRNEWLDRLGELQTRLAMTCALMLATGIGGGMVCLMYMLSVSTAESREGQIGIAWSVAAISSLVILLFALVIPFAVANYAGEWFLARALPLLHVLSVMLRPLVWALSTCESVFRDLLGRAENSREEAEVQADQEILSVISETEKKGLMGERERDMIESVIEFYNHDVESIMTPRTEVVGVLADTTVEDIKELVRKRGHSRFPVYEETIDHILGVLYIKDLLILDTQERFDLKENMRPVVFVPESKPLSELLKQFQEDKVQLAIVLDEYGGTAGLVTIEDILEELVGDISDEFDRSKPPPIQRIDENTVEVEARTHIDELNDALDISLPESEDYETVGGFVFATLGRIPPAGETFDHGNLRIHVLDAEERKINRLSVHVGRKVVEPSEP